MTRRIDYVLRMTQIPAVVSFQNHRQLPNSLRYSVHGNEYAFEPLAVCAPTMATQAVLLLLSSLCAQFLTGYGATLPEYPSQPLPLSGLLNNKAATSANGHGSAANFDGAGSAYDSQFLPTGSWEYDGLSVRSAPSLPTFPEVFPVCSPIVVGQER